MNRASALAFHDLAIGFPKETVAFSVSGAKTIATKLQGSLEVGSFTVLLGRNGVGKTTLLRTLAGLHPALGGTIAIEGRPLADWTPAERARKIAVVLTERPAAGLLTGRQLVALGRYPHTSFFGHLSSTDHQAVEAALAATGSLDLADRPLRELSDGEQQRLALARALAQEAPVLILDEITAFLDITRRIEMIELLRHLARCHDRAILLASHDLELLLRSADRFWLLGEGGQWQSGLPEDLASAGYLDTLLPDQLVRLDSATGGLRRVPDGRRPIRLIGSGDRAAWIGRALERCGFTLAAEANWSVEVVDSEHGLRLQQGANTADHTSDLETLIDRLETLYPLH